MNRPDFFIVGAPKCGTTAMARYLSQHPDVFVSPVKEAHFFATDFRYSAKYPRLDQQQYLAPFAGAGACRRSGEASVFHLYSQVAAERIERFAPGADIIIMLRDPVDMLQSFHRQLVFDCDEEIDDLEQALAAEHDRKRQSGGPPHVAVAEMRYYRDVVSVSRQVERFLEVFGRARVHVTLYDDLGRDTAAAYADTLRFLGVSDAFAPSFDVVNPHKRLRSPALGRLLKTRLQYMAPSTRAAVRAILPDRLRHGLFQTLTRWNTRVEPRPSISPRMQERLCAELRPEVDRLEQLIGRDLRAWCRMP
jgi:hypothetical protein